MASMNPLEQAVYDAVYREFKAQVYDIEAPIWGHRVAAQAVNAMRSYLTKNGAPQVTTSAELREEG